jgi:hypothetical protein
VASRGWDMSFEARGEPLLSRAAFAGRVLASCAAAALLISASLYGGMCGYRYFEGMSWVDAFVNAAMILSGMGPMNTLHTNGGKIFAGCYALYSGLMVIIATALILAPVVHRLMHQFHLEAEEG